MLSLITAQVGHQNECRGDVGRTVEMHKKKSCESIQEKSVAIKDKY